MFVDCLDLIWDGMSQAVGFFRSVQIVSGVSVWTVLCCTFVLSVVIAGLVNVVRIGGLSARAISSRRRKGDDD
mgnify:CR=1 FL=1